MQFSVYHSATLVAQSSLSQGAGINGCVIGQSRGEAWPLCDISCGDFVQKISALPSRTPARAAEPLLHDPVNSVTDCAELNSDCPTKVTRRGFSGLAPHAANRTMVGRAPLNIIESRNVPTFRQYAFLLFLRRLAGFSNSAGAFGCRR
jgi:hypothetical protein